MKDKLEKFIIEHREAFDKYEPDPKLWDQIQTKKPFLFGKRWNGIMMKAAVVLFIFSISFLFSEYLHQHDIAPFAKKERINTTNIPELEEAEVYYTNLMKEKMERINVLLSENPDVKEEINNDLAELDHINHDLKNDLTDNIDNKQVIEALIQHYRLKLEILEEIVNELEETKKEVNNEKRKYNI